MRYGVTLGLIFAFYGGCWLIFAESKWAFDHSQWFCACCAAVFAWGVILSPVFAIVLGCFEGLARKVDVLRECIEGDDHEHVGRSHSASAEGPVVAPVLSLGFLGALVTLGYVGITGHSPTQEGVENVLLCTLPLFICGLFLGWLFAAILVASDQIRDRFH